MGVRSIGAVVAVMAVVAAPAAASPQLAGEFEVRGTPGDIAVTPDGAAWVALASLSRDVARIDPSGVVSHHLSGASHGMPRAIAVGSDGRLWVAWAGGVGHFRPDDPAGTATRLEVPALTNPHDLIAGPGGKLYAVSGQRLFIIEPNGDRATVAPPEGLAVEGLQDGRALAMLSDGRLMIADHAGHQLVVFDPISRAATAAPLGGAPEALDVSADGRVVVTVAPGRVFVARPGVEGVVHHVGVARTAAALLGEDGRLWLPHLDGGRLLSMDDDGRVADGPAFADGPPAGAAHLERGPGGVIWASLEYPGAHDYGRVARIVGVGVAPPPAPPAPQPEPAPEAPAPGPPPTATTSTPRADRTAPRLRLLGVTARVVPGVANRLRVQVSERAAVSVVVQRRIAGRRVAGGPCRAAARVSAGTRACVRWASVTRLGRTAGPGRVDLVLPARVKGRPLVAGRYRMTISARDAAGNRSIPVVGRFEVAAVR